MTVLVLVLTASAAALLLAGAATDAWSNRIPNRLVLAGLVLAASAAFAAGGASGLLASLAAAGAAFVLGFGGFAIGAFGGGDAKFLMVGGAFVGLEQLVPYLLAAAVGGGVLAITVVLWRRQSMEAAVMTGGLLKYGVTLGRKGHRAALGDSERITVPYGVAIAVGALATQFTPWAEWILS